jgi:hypothetical protein
MIRTNTVNAIANVVFRSVVAENRQRQRREQFIGAVKAVFDLRIDEFDHELDEILEFTRHAGFGGARGEEE